MSPHRISGRADVPRPPIYGRRAPILRAGPARYRRYGTAHRRLRRVHATSMVSARRPLAEGSHDPPAQRPAHPRPDVRHPRPVRHADPGRSRRRDRQGRAARGRQHAPRGAAGRAGPLRHLRQLQPQQALGRARPQDRGRQEGAPEADPDRRRLRPQHAPGGDGQARLHLRCRARRQSQDRLRRRHRLRAARALRRQARLRRRGPGRLRLCRPVPDARRPPAVCADHRRRQGLGPAPDLRAALRPPVPRAHRRGARLRRGADVRADGGLQPVRAPEPRHLRGGRQGRLRPRHLPEPAALQDQGRLGRRAAVYRAQLGQGADRDRPRRRVRPAAGAERHRAQPAGRRALRHPRRGAGLAHDGGVARNLRPARHPLPAGAAAGRPAEGPPPRRRRLLQAEFQLAHPGHTHPAPGHDRRRDDRRPGLGPAPARRRYRRHPAPGRLQRGGDRRGAAATIQDRCRRAGTSPPEMHADRLHHAGARSHFPAASANYLC